MYNAKQVSDLEKMSYNELEDDDLLMVSDMRSINRKKGTIERVSKAICIGDLKKYFQKKDER